MNIQQTSSKIAFKLIECVNFLNGAHQENITQKVNLKIPTICHVKIRIFPSVHFMLHSAKEKHEK
jgi:hypothetical protein